MKGVVDGAMVGNITYAFIKNVNGQVLMKSK
jgi:hypothetical protein